ncbi:uncharacterized protein BCR38DRAFT_404772 [Pseudomassariella vexata]|uniref:DUF676 domain-containing protein n=1 Tax=Pseudomassariella vexata TaxID=1141098 RepID=A0A1Y2EJH7_9PEZI|nr:uncharacterized protein BCR38DRAFT_404772 [Pseudomassariella vexata]ORY71719.1 hypothetical protein BCR38DRAFT_404772 [Pseudomassariella vexata]
MSIMDSKMPSQPSPSLDVPRRIGTRFGTPGAGYSDVYGRDPRSSSMQSLTPSLPEYEEVERRKLLLVYIHGFMGNDTSFQSFPAHVHKYLKTALAETHAIHSKVYPKYKTYKAIEVARDNFSRWLEPHESPTTDVVLPTRDRYDPRLFQHRILGTVNLDAPLLGLHPGIIVSGISSLFRPKPDNDNDKDTRQAFNTVGQYNNASQGSGMTSPNQSSVYLPSIQSGPSTPSVAPSISPAPAPAPAPGMFPAMTYDPNFNPNFPNDVRLEERGWWQNIVHFVKKHNSEGLVDAATHHIMSHLEFGSVLMDLNCLKIRYENLRKLEDVDDIKHYGMPHVAPRVRFIQYYTICHGYPKKPKTPKTEPKAEISSLRAGNDTNTAPSTPRISVEDHSSNAGQGQVQPLRTIPKEDSAALNVSEDERSSMELEMLDPEPISEEFHTPEGSRQGSPPPSHQAGAPPPVPATQSADTKDGDINQPRSQENHPSKVTTASAVKNGLEPAGVEPSVSNMPESDTDAVAVATTSTDEMADELAALTLDLPPIPDIPEKPVAPDFSKYTDKDARKQAEKEAKRVQKSYDQAVKNRDKAIKERQKIIEKRKKKRAQEVDKREKEAQKQRKKEEQAAATAAAKAAAEDRNFLAEDAAATSMTSTDTIAASAVSQQPPLSQAPSGLNQESSRASVDSGLQPNSSERTQQQRSSKPEKAPKPPKERKFCSLPSKVNGQMDPKWVKIFMKDVDEVGAHTGLFFPGPHYEKLVGDVGDMIVSWVQEDATKRAILALQ